MWQKAARPQTELCWGGAMLVGWVELWVGGGGFLRGMVGRGEECHRLNLGRTRETKCKV